MNINEEGKYYASMVRKFRTEYNSKNLHGFCSDQKVVSIRRKPYCAPRKSFAPLHRDFKMFKLWYKARKHSTTASQS